MSVAEEILALYAARGAGAYFGERVSMTEHALQSAYCAQQAGASESLVLAALLHDVGHLLAQVPDDLADWTADAHHEASGARCQRVSCTEPAMRVLYSASCGVLSPATLPASSQRRTRTASVK